MVVFVTSNIMTYKITYEKSQLIDGISKSDYTVGYWTASSTLNQVNVERPLPSVSGLLNDELEQKINRNLQSVFLDWLPEKFNYPESTYQGTTINTNSYLCIRINYVLSGKAPNRVWICNTIDMSTGDIIYLDDLIEVNKEFARLILTDGVVKLHYNWITEEFDANYPSLDKEDENDILEKLIMCSEPFGEDNWLFKPTFYLKKNRLYLLNIFNEESECYIELNKIEDKLKVDKW